LDPETIWQKTSAVLALAVIVLLIQCLRLWADVSTYQSQVQKISELNDRQKKIIGKNDRQLKEIGKDLEQVRTTMTDMIEKMDKLITAPKTQPGFAAATSESTATSAADVAVSNHTLAADFNEDGIVDWADFEIFTRSWGKSGASPSDLNQDNQVDWKDFQVFAGQWMKTESWFRGTSNNATASVTR